MSNSTRTAGTVTEMRNQRLAAGLTRGELASIMGYSYNAVSSVEQGDFLPGKKYKRRFNDIMKKIAKGELWHVVKIKAKVGTVPEGTTVLKKAIPCACRCGEHLIPVIWNQRYLPGHSPRKPGKRKKKT